MKLTPEQLKSLTEAAEAVHNPLGIIERLRLKTQTDADIEALVFVYPQLALQVYRHAGDAFLELVAKNERAAKRMLDLIASDGC